MLRRVAALVIVAAAVLPAAPALAAQGCPPGTFASPTGLYNPLTGKPVMYCAIDWPAP